jgi:hypothetical protein
MKFSLNATNLSSTGMVATVVRNTTIDTDQLAKLITERMRTLDASTVKGVFEALRTVLIEELAKGNSVNIENLLNFKTTIQGTFDTSGPTSNDVNFKAVFSQSLVRKARGLISFQQVQSVAKSPLIKSAKNSQGFGIIDPLTNILTVDGNNLTHPSSPLDVNPDLGIKLKNTVSEVEISPMSYVLNQPAKMIGLFPDTVYNSSTITAPHYNEFELSVVTKFTQGGDKRTAVGPRIKAPIVDTLTSEASTLPIFYVKEMTAVEGMALQPPLTLAGIYDNLPTAPFSEVYEFYVGIMPVNQISTTNPLATLFTVTVYSVTSLVIKGTATFTVSDIRDAPVQVDLTSAISSASNISQLTGIKIEETVREGTYGTESILTLLNMHNKKAYANGLYEKIKLTLNIAS